MAESGFDWKGIAAKILPYAPLVADALINPAGAALGAVGLLAKQLGITSGDATPEIIQKKLSSMPENELQLAAIKAEHDFSLQMRQQDSADLKSVLQAIQETLREQNDQMGKYLGDTQNARNMAVEKTKATGKQDLNLYVLAYVIMGGFFGTVIAIILLAIFAPSIKLESPALNLLLGSLSTDAGMVVGYYFGSSKGSNEKNDVFAGLQDKFMKIISKFEQKAEKA